MSHKTLLYCLLILAIATLIACQPATTGEIQEIPSRNDDPDVTLEVPVEDLESQLDDQENPPPGIAEVFPYEVEAPRDLSPQAQLDYQAEWTRFNEISKRMREGENYENLTPEEQQFVGGFDETRPSSIFYTGALEGSWYEAGGPYWVTSSSSLPDSPPNSYIPENVHDFDLSTAWVEGVDGEGIGESISFHFKPNTAGVAEVKIFNGYLKSREAWQNNNRVRALKVYVDELAVAILKLEDTSGLQKFQLGKPFRPGGEDMIIRFEILDIYKGAKFDDTALTELEFDGEYN